MKMKARVRVLHEIESDHDIPDPEFQDLEPPPGDRHPEKRKAQVMVNESKVQKARIKAAKDIEKEVKGMFPDAIEIAVEEVMEA